MPWLVFLRDGHEAVTALADGVDPAKEAARLGAKDYEVRDERPIVIRPAGVPRSIPMHAARITLRRHGLLAAANAAAQAAGGEVLDAWEYAPSIARSSPTMKGVQAALGLSEADVDALFVAATDLII